MWLLILSAVLIILIYVKLKSRYKHWEKQGVQHPKPYPLFGNAETLLFRRKAFAYFSTDVYNFCPNERYVGLYTFLTPILMLRDPDLIKQITIKDFEYFPDRQALVTGDADPLMNRSLVSKSFKDGWHDLRTTVSPAFTSSKMRLMFALMQQCSKEFVNYFKNQSDTITVEMKDAFSRYTTDVIGSTAFGVTCNSLKDKENEFYLVAKDASNFGGSRLFKIVGFSNFPKFMELFKITLLGEKVNNFFRRLIKETIRIREEKGIVRPDIVHLLMLAKKGRLKDDETKDVIESSFAVTKEYNLGKTQKNKSFEITDEDITAQALAFLLGGAEAPSTLVSYAAYELALNPEVQENLQKEIDKVYEEGDNQISYEALLGMKYLDCVVSETLRKHPPSPLSDRVCAKSYTIEPIRPDEKPVHFEKGDVIWIPTYAIQRDPKHYPDPEKFIPERFSDENKHDLKPFTYFPFGSGPRNCVGSRFALLESKLILADLLREYTIVPVEKTAIPLVHDPKNAAPLPKEGFWLGLRARKV